MMSTASRQCAIEGLGLMAVSRIVEMDRQQRGVRGLDGRRASSEIQNGLSAKPRFSARFQGCLSFFVSVQILMRRFEGRPRFGQCRSAVSGGTSRERVAHSARPLVSI
jgi:hypothetical protein